MVTGNLKCVPVFLLLFAAPPSASAAQPWDTPFASDTAALLKSATQVSTPDDQELDVLLEEHRIFVEANGRVRGTFRKVYRILKDDAVEDWSSIEETYQPWCEQKPAIRARVITKAGTVHTLDPKTIVDAPAAEFDASIFSD